MPAGRLHLRRNGHERSRCLAGSTSRVTWLQRTLVMISPSAGRRPLLGVHSLEGCCVSRLPLDAELAAVFENVRRRQGGEVATYIPALAKADPDWFGVSLMTVDGGSYHLGDSEQPFTIQSVSKPFVFGLALDEHGVDATLASGGRGAVGRSVQRHRAGSEDPPPVQPDGQHRRDRDDVLGQGPDAAGADRVDRARAEPVRGPQAGDRRGRLRLRARDRGPQLRDRLPVAQLRHARRRRRRCRRGLLQAVLGAGHRPRSRRHGRHPGQPGRQPCHREARPARGTRRPGAVGHEHLRHVRLCGRMGVPGRATREVGRLRRGGGGTAWRVRTGRVLAAAGRARQQRPGHRVRRGALGAVRHPPDGQATDRAPGRAPYLPRRRGALQAGALRRREHPAA